ncbi:MAG TPA: GNAT family N-acetyltransferase [Gemmatimonadales bacterium]
MAAVETPSLIIQRLPSAALSPSTATAVRALCESAYEEDLAKYFDALGPGEHLLGWQDGTLASHLMWVTRWLQPGDRPLLRTAYVELVATAPAMQRRGYASTLLKYFPSQVTDFDIAALSPATENLYVRQGWRLWRGPLAVRTTDGLVPTPDEEIMVLLLPRSPMLNSDLPLSVEWRDGEVW